MIAIIDIPYFAQSKKIISLDSDILFFKPPKTIIKWIRNKKNDQELLYMQDYVDAYVLSKNIIRKKYGLNVISKFNMGILCYQKKTFTLSETNTYFSLLHKQKVGQVMLRDQTFWMLHALQNYQCILPLNSNYIVSFASPKTPKTVCFHYTSEIRSKIYTAGVELLFAFDLL